MQIKLNYAENYAQPYGFDMAILACSAMLVNTGVIFAQVCFRIRLSASHLLHILSGWKRFNALNVSLSASSLAIVECKQSQLRPVSLCFFIECCTLEWESDWLTVMRA